MMTATVDGLTFSDSKKQKNKTLAFKLNQSKANVLFKQKLQISEQFSNKSAFDTWSKIKKQTTNKKKNSFTTSERLEADYIQL